MRLSVPRDVTSASVRWSVVGRCRPSALHRAPAGRDHRYMRCVADVMTRDVQTITTSEVVGSIRDLMLDDGIHGVPVLDVKGAVAGIVTSSDLVEGHPPELSVTAVMTDQVISVPADTTLVEAARTMLYAQIHHIVVLDNDGAVVGLVSSLDLLHELAGDVEVHESRTVSGRRPAVSGDLILIRGRTVGQRERRGTIVEARGDDGGPPYLVRWHDDPHDEPHEVLFFPGSDATVVARADDPD